jgi:hypothetical protein
MATERQYDFYKLLYDEENARLEQLRTQAKHYLSLATLYSAFVVFFVDKVLPAIEAENKQQPSSVLAMKIIFIATICAMGASFLCSLLVIQVSTFEALTSPRDIIKQIEDREVTDKEFFNSRIADITVAFDRNSAVIDRKANVLQCAGYALLVGILLHATFFIVRIF